MFKNTNDVTFITSVAKASKLPRYQFPEVAFIGKSNVGKSSLINALCNHKHLAKVSNTPGRTQQINFFSIAGKAILVDLPGYGFAKVPDSIKKNWENLIIEYLKYRDNLKMANVLIDSRRGIKENDITIIKLLITYYIPFQIILTKADQIKFSETQELISSTSNTISELISQFNINELSKNINIILTSTKNKEGIKTLRNNLSKILS